MLRGRRERRGKYTYSFVLKNKYVEKLAQMSLWVIWGKRLHLLLQLFPIRILIYISGCALKNMSMRAGLGDPWGRP